MDQISPRQSEVLPAEQKQLPSGDPNQERHRRRIAQWVGLAAVAVLAALVGVGAWGEAKRHAETLATLTTERDAVPVVRTEVLKLAGTPPRIELTGSTQAFDAATLFARATGYI